MAFRQLNIQLIPNFSANNTIYQPLRSGRIWHKVNFVTGVLLEYDGAAVEDASWLHKEWDT